MGNAVVIGVVIVIIGACVGYWVNMNTKKNKSE
jgi:hypothetical protein